MIDCIPTPETVQDPCQSHSTDWQAMFYRMREEYEHEHELRLEAEAELERVRQYNRKHIADDLYETALLSNDDKGMQEADKLFHMGLRSWQHQRVPKSDDYTGPDQMRYLRFYRAELAQVCGQNVDWVTDRLKRAEEMGTIARATKTLPPTGDQKRPDTLLYVAITPAFERPQDMHIEPRGKGRGGDRRECAQCHGHRFKSRVLVREFTCLDCGHVEVEHVDEPAEEMDDPFTVEADGEKQPDPTPRPTPVPFPTRPAPQPQPIERPQPKAAYSTPCKESPVGIHEYASQRTADGRRKCIECGQPEPRAEVH